ncbi:MAG: hypothetical protein ACPGSB_07720 [Opitutales bacterium]
MHHRLTSYLRDNRDHIIENWLTEAEIPAPRDESGQSSGDGVVPYAFFKTAFENVLHRVEFGAGKEKENSDLTHLNSFLGLTCECKQRCLGGRVCMELHDSGLSAFMSVFDEKWDTSQEFSALDRECTEDLINHALSAFFGKEIELCAHRTFRTDCPFAAHN